jgi:hypothetical protein
VTPPDPCAGKTITIINSNPTASDKCNGNGTVIVRATGSTGFTFRVDGTSYTSDSILYPLPAGLVTIYAKDADGCITTKEITVPVAPKGSLFAAVSAIINTKCNAGTCHTTGAGGAPTGILDEDCEIVARKSEINTRAVVGAEGGLTQNEKDAIANWISAGGKYVN